VDAGPAVRHRRRAAGVHAEEISLDDVIAGIAQPEAGVAVSGNDVSLAGAAAADRDVMRAVEDADAAERIADRVAAGGVEADEVSLNAGEGGVRIADPQSVLRVP